MKFSIDFIQQVAWSPLARLYRVFGIVYLHCLNELIKNLDYYLENNHICLSTYLYTYLLTYYLSIYWASIFLSFFLPIYPSIYPSITHLSFFPSFLPSFHMSTCLSGKVNLKSGKTLMSYSWSGNFKWCLLTIIFIQYLLTISIWSYNVYCNKEYEKHGFACMDRYGVNTRDALLQNPNSLYHEATT